MRWCQGLLTSSYWPQLQPGIVFIVVSCACFSFQHQVLALMCFHITFCLKLNHLYFHCLSILSVWENWNLAFWLNYPIKFQKLKDSITHLNSDSSVFKEIKINIKNSLHDNFFRVIQFKYIYTYQYWITLFGITLLALICLIKEVFNRLIYHNHS